MEFRNDLPPQFRTWSELYNGVKHHFNEKGNVIRYNRRDIVDGDIVETHWDWSINFIKAKVFDEIQPNLITRKELDILQHQIYIAKVNPFAVEVVLQKMSVIANFNES